MRKTVVRRSFSCSRMWVGLVRAIWSALAVTVAASGPGSPLLGAQDTAAPASAINIAVVRHDGNFRAATWLASGALDLHNAFVDLGNLLFEELHEEGRVGTRQDDLRSLAAHLDIEDEGTDTITLAIAFARDLFLLG